ncbi:hypothetical protein MUK42_15763 [Musa troglodytarum]|uniref:Uncharacterized protein n=1 Tax=Musa troglodytarum TaxID=320322 RepID=A0A9E7HWL7_9LILI|nr:hypothetical protein MUK42_15763 [Musa troglodytarum]
MPHVSGIKTFAINTSSHAVELLKPSTRLHSVASSLLPSPLPPVRRKNGVAEGCQTCRAYGAEQRACQGRRGLREAAAGVEAGPEETREAPRAQEEGEERQAERQKLMAAAPGACFIFRFQRLCSITVLWMLLSWYELVM